MALIGVASAAVERREAGPLRVLRDGAEHSEGAAASADAASWCAPSGAPPPFLSRAAQRTGVAVGMPKPGCGASRGRCRFSTSPRARGEQRRPLDAVLELRTPMESIGFGGERRG